MFFHQRPLAFLIGSLVLNCGLVLPGMGKRRGRIDRRQAEGNRYAEVSEAGR